MPYQGQLAQALADRGYESIWFPFSGQLGTSCGKFSIRSGADDLARVVGQVDALLGKADGLPSIVSHCASALIAIEYLRHRDNSRVAKLIAYSPLVKPRRIKARAEQRLAEAGVRSGLSDLDWDYNVKNRISSLEELPVLLCHVGDSLNRERATLAELQNVAKDVSTAMVVSCPHGYDLRSDHVGTFASLYVNWLQR